jgi:hypothetical protein
MNSFVRNFTSYAVLLLALSSNVFAQGQEISGKIGQDAAIDTVLFVMEKQRVIGDSFSVVIQIDTSAKAPRKYVLEVAPLIWGFRYTPNDTLRAYVAVGDTIRTQNKVSRLGIYKNVGSHIGLRVRNTKDDSTGYGGGEPAKIRGAVAY